MVVDLVVEEALVELERQREAAHQVGGEALHGAEIIDVGRLERGRLGRPQVGREMRAGDRAGEIGIARRHVDRPDHQRLVEVARARDAARARHRLALERDVAAGDVGRRARDRHLGGERQVEELARHAVDRVDQAHGHAVTGDHQEADAAAGVGDGARHRSPRDGGAVAEPREIDNRHAGHRPVSFADPTAGAVA